MGRRHKEVQKRLEEGNREDNSPDTGRKKGAY